MKINRRVIDIQKARIIRRAERLNAVALDPWLSLPLDVHTLPSTTPAEMRERLARLSGRDLRAKDCGVYAFEFLDVDVAKALANFNRFRSTNSGKPKTPKLMNRGESSFLYVGKSNKGIWERIFQHVTGAKADVTSLRLQ